MNDTVVKVIQYADDTTCILKNEVSVENLFNLVNIFTKVSGLKLNVNKSQAMWLGSKRFSKEKLFNIDWPEEPIKALGFVFLTISSRLKNQILIQKFRK